MLLEILLAFFLGILVGTLTGLTPGLHINLIAPLILVLSSPVSISPIFLIIFIVSLSIAHTFLDFIPSTFLGCPNEDTALSILPSHRMLLEGKGHNALVYSLFGGLLGIFISLLLTLPLIYLMPLIYPYLKSVMFLILISTVCFLLIKEEHFFISLLIFLLSGFLGLATLNLNLKDSLLPLLSGLFGSSSLLVSLKEKNNLPPQEISEISKIKPKLGELKNPLIASLLSAPLCSFLPALGTNQAAIISSDIVEERSQKNYLILIGSLNTLMLILSFITLFAINKSRTGSAAYIGNLVSLTPPLLLVILLNSLISGVIAFTISIKISKIFAKTIPKINYQLVSKLILIFLFILICIFSGFLGLLVFIVATIIGLSCIQMNIRRTNLMGSLMLPSIIFYLPF